MARPKPEDTPVMRMIFMASTSFPPVGAGRYSVAAQPLHGTIIAQKGENEKALCKLPDKTNSAGEPALKFFAN
ncbi:MAG: hypothetical protein SPD95_06580, partial [Candidatus Faecousia sp.]|nr:hypothetical protein [Candidatus Faecousia sp.]